MFYECSLRACFPHVLCMSSVCSECALNCIDHVVILSEYSDTAVGPSENFKNSSSPLLCGELLEELKIFNMFLVALPQVDLEELKNIQNVALPRVYLVVHGCVKIEPRSSPRSVKLSAKSQTCEIVNAVL